MDFIKSLRSSGPSSTIKSNLTRMNSTRIQDGPVTRPPTNKPSLRERFMQPTKSSSRQSQSNTERLKLQREETRKNQRMNRFNSCRMTGTNEIDKSDIESNISCIKIPENLSPRKKKLMEWRNRKAMAPKPVENRPAWRVTNSSSGLFENKKPIPKSYSFNSTRMNSMQTSYRQNSTLISKPPPKKDIQYFGSQIDSSNSKFTFTASVENFHEFVKRRESDNKTPTTVEKVESKFTPTIETSEFENIRKNLKPEDRAFLDETMEMRNEFLKNRDSKFQSTAKFDKDEYRSMPKPLETPISYIPEETIGIKKNTNSVATSIETITSKINETLNLETPKAAERINDDDEYQTPVTAINNQNLYVTPTITITPVADAPTTPDHLKNITKTPPVTEFVSKRPTSPVLFINDKVIISPIKTQLEEKFDIDANSNPQDAVKYYRKLVVDKTLLLKDLATTWDKVCETVIDPPLSDDNQGDIRCACGLASLLIEERFSQFNELIDKCENTNKIDNLSKELESKLVLPSDLQGFWDMINHQVVDVEKRFFNLDKLKKNNWIEIIELPASRVKTDPARFKAKINPLRRKNSENLESADKPKPKPKTSAKSKFAEFKAKMAAAKKEQNKDEIQVDILTSTNADSLDIATSKDQIKIKSPVNVSKKFNQITEVFLSANTTPKRVEEKPKSRKSIKPEISSENIIKPVENQEKKYTLRSRRSDLIKWDSPAQNASPKRIVTKGIFTLPSFESTIVEATEVANKKPETAIVFDFDDDYEPIVFGKAKKGEGVNQENQSTKKTNKENNKFNPLNMNSPKTPQNMRQRDIFCNSNEMVKSNPNHLKCISNSPLLKLAMISSHGKRQSLSTGKHVRPSFQSETDNILNFGL